jgi:hypothetical protein
VFTRDVSTAVVWHEALGVVPAPEVVVDTNGTSFLAALGLACVDASRTTCNDPLVVAEVLGIEAARGLLLRELRGVMASLDVNLRHLLLLVDCMTGAARHFAGGGVGWGGVGDWHACVSCGFGVRGFICRESGCAAVLFVCVAFVPMIMLFGRMFALVAPCLVFARVRVAPSRSLLRARPRS